MRTIIITIFVLTLLNGCTSNREQDEAVRNESDSIIFHTAMLRQIDHSLFVIDSLENQKKITHQRADYWRGYSYDMCWKSRLANHFYQRAFDAFKEPIKDWHFYLEGGYRLAVMRHNLKDTEGALQLITDIMKKADSQGQLPDKKRAFMLDFMIDCLVDLHQYDKAKSYCAQSYDMLVSDSSNDYGNKMIKCFSIVNALCQMEDYDEASSWLQQGEQALQNFEMQIAQEGDSIERSLVNEYHGHASLYRAYILQMKGKEVEAAQVFDAIPDSQLFHPSSIFEAGEYLTKAGRYEEALAFYDKFKTKYTDDTESGATLDDILSNLVPIYLVNMKAGHTEDALSIANTICETLDSALTRQKKNDIAELCIIYETQQQEIKLQQTEFRATIYLLSAIALVLLVILVGWSHLRTRKYNKVLAEKNRELYEEVRLCDRHEQQAEHQLAKMPVELLTQAQQLYRRICSTMDAEKPYINPDLNREDLARMLGTNYKYVADAIRECSGGMTTSEFINRYRINYAADLLVTTDDSVTLVASLAGFNNRSHFNKVFRERYKMTPTEYRNIAKN